jgi:hypothetical protein
MKAKMKDLEKAGDYQNQPNLHGTPYLLHRKLDFHP